MIYKKVNTNLSQSLNEIELEKAKRDDYAKCILADPQILARIVKGTVEEFKNLSIEEIMSGIGETVVSLTVPEQLCVKIQSVGTEDIDEEEGKIIYDIRFPLYHNGKTSKFLINVEAQKSTRFSKLKYHIENRMTYYMAKMISSQKNVEFIKSNYDDIKPVYSIWICMDTSVNEDSIIEIGLQSEVVFGKSDWIPECNLIHGTVIRIRESEKAEKLKNTLIAMLELLFSKTPKEEKKRQLEEQYDLKMTTELEGCVNDMCNISDLFEEQALERGMKQGEALKLISQIMKKVRRGKAPETIADELEESADTIRPIYEVVKQCTFDCTPEEIYKKLYG